MKTDTFIKIIMSEACGLASLLWGDLDGMFISLIIFMILDYITGVMVGICTKELDSSAGFRGIVRKVTMLIVVAVGHTIDQYVLGGGTAVCKCAVVGFYLANEGISILENTAKLGVKYPKKLLEILKQLHDKSDE